MAFSYYSSLIVFTVVIMATAARALCPPPCYCQYQNIYFVTSCSGKGLAISTNGTFDNRTNYLYLINNTMKSVPVGMFHNTKILLALYFRGNQFYSLPTGIFQNNKFLMILSLYNNELESLPIGIFDNNPNIFYLYLNNNHLTSLPASIFRNNRHLFHLDLNNNYLSSLPEGIFNANQNLVVLNLFSNRLTSLPVGIFRNNPKLYHLTLDNNKLKSLSAGIFINNTLLSTLTLRINQLTSLPTRIFTNNKQLTKLSLELNQLKLSTGLLDNNTVLKTLALTWNRLESLPPGIFDKNERLQELYLDYNRLTALPDGIFRNNQQLTRVLLTSNPITFLRSGVFRNNGKLKYLEANDMKLRSLPSGFFDNNKELQTISLSNNQLKSLPLGAFDKNELLEMMYFTNNQLKDLPTAIFRNNLKVYRLDLYGNPLKSYPVGITNLPQLSHLSLASCQLTYLPSKAFHGFPLITFISLNSNQLKFLPKGLLDNNKFLTFLSLSNNQLVTLPEVLLNNNTFLRNLYMEANKLSTLSENSFYNNPQLNQLILSSNQLTSLPFGIFKNNPLLGTLYLDHNKLKSLPDGLLDYNTNIFNLVVHSNMLTERYFHLDRILGNATKLKTLMLHHNNITSVTLGQALVNLPNLFALFASYNNIEHIEDYSFSKSPSLSHILLNNNQLKYISNGTFYGASQLKSLFLMANPIEFIADGAFSSNTIMETLYVLQTNLKRVNAKWYNPFFVYQAGTVIQIYTTKNPEASITVTTELEGGYNSSGFQCINRKSDSTLICTPCLSGSYITHSVFNGYICTDCPAGGFYQDTIAVYKEQALYGNGCKLCDNGTFVRTAPGRAQEDCRPCPEGTNTAVFAGFRACRCQDGFYRLDRFDKCYPCPASGVTCFNESMTLKDGYYWQWKSKSDKDHYINFTNDLQVFDDSYDRDLVQFNGSFPQHYQCPRSESCLGGLDAECAEGYVGPLCAVCEKRHYQLVANCFKCPSIPWLIFQICGISLLVMTIIFVVVKGKKRKADDKRSLTDIILARLKIIISFYQISSGTLDAFSYVQWPSALTKMSEYANFVQLNILQIAPLHCFNSRFKIDTYTHFVITCSLTAGVILIALFYYKLKSVYIGKRTDKSSIQSELDDTKEACYRNVFLFIFITYPQTCSEIFQILPASCHKICQDNSQQHCISYLKADYTITCFTAKYNRYVILAYAALIYPFAVPLLTVAVLWKYHYKRTFVKADDNSQNEITKTMAGEDYSTSTATARQEIITTNKRIQSQDRSAFKSQGEHLEIIPEEQESIANRLSAKESHNPKDIKLRISEDITVKEQTQEDTNTKSKNSDISTIPIVAGMSFIFENYSENCWFWETLEMTRKLLLTSSLALIGAEGRTSLGIASILSGCYAILHAHFKPIPDKFEHALQLTSLLVTFANTCIGMMLKIDQGALLDADAKIMDSLIITVLLVTANVMVTFLVVVKYTIAIGQSAYYLIKNPRCSLECCLSIMLTIDEVKGEARSMDDNSAWKMNTQLSQGNDFEVPGVRDVAGDFGLTAVELGDKDEDEGQDKCPENEMKQGDNNLKE